MLGAFLRQPFDIPATSEPRPVITDPRARQVAEVAGLAYELTLHTLLRYFTHTDETDEQLDVLVDAAFDLMARVLAPVAASLTTLPIGPAHPGCTAGFAFEMYYVLGNMAPHREAAWALLSERAQILARRCGEVASADGASPALAAATAKAGTIAAGLAAHVPPELRPRSAPV